MTGIGDMMKNVREMQARMESMQREIADLRVTGESGAGLVSVEMNGRHDVGRVTIDPALAREDLGVLEDLVAAAVNDAVRRVEQAQQQKMSELTQGLPIPPGMNLFR